MEIQAGFQGCTVNFTIGEARIAHHCDEVRVRVDAQRQEHVRQNLDPDSTVDLNALFETEDIKRRLALLTPSLGKEATWNCVQAELALSSREDQLSTTDTVFAHHVGPIEMTAEELERLEETARMIAESCRQARQDDAATEDRLPEQRYMALVDKMISAEDVVVAIQKHVPLS